MPVHCRALVYTESIHQSSNRLKLTLVFQAWSKANSSQMLLACVLCALLCVADCQYCTLQCSCWWWGNVSCSYPLALFLCWSTNLCCLILLKTLLILSTAMYLFLLSTTLRGATALLTLWLFVHWLSCLVSIKETKTGKNMPFFKILF